jgi:hypothetical protein
LKKKDFLAEHKLTASIHTVNVRSDYAPALHNFDEKIVKVRQKLNKETGEMVSHSIINPNNYGMGELQKYSRYEAVMSHLMKKANVSDYSYDRIDFRFDSYEDTFSQYFKLNSILLGLFTMKYAFRNNEPTESVGQITRSKYGVTIKNQSMELVYYDKEKESNGRNPCKARLEFRAKRLDGNLPPAIFRTWVKRLYKVESHYDELQKYYNECLHKHYLSWLEECCPERNGKDMITSFVRENRNSFFTNQQLQNFCAMCGVVNPESRAKNLKQSCSIEFFSRKDVRAYIKKLMYCIKDFIEQ